jgi:hypothetical protein
VVARSNMKILRNVLPIVIVVVLVYLLSGEFGEIYRSVFPSEPYRDFFSLSDTSSNFIIGLPISYLFFLFLLFTAFGDTHKKWWIGIGTIPAAVILLYFDFSHIYFHAIFPIAGWLLGLGIARLLSFTRTD